MGVKTERKRVDSLCDDDEQKRAHFKAISEPPPSPSNSPDSKEQQQQQEDNNNGGIQFLIFALQILCIKCICCLHASNAFLPLPLPLHHCHAPTRRKG